jgi:hypothetical protein
LPLKPQVTTGNDGSLFRPPGQDPPELHAQALIKLGQLISVVDNAASFQVRQATATEMSSARLAFAKADLTETAAIFFRFKYHALVYDYALNGQVVQVSNVFASSSLLRDKDGLPRCWYVYTGGNRDALACHTNLTSLGLKRDSGAVKTGQKELCRVLMEAWSDHVTNAVAYMNDGQVDIASVLAVCGKTISVAVSPVAVVFLLVGCGYVSGVAAVLVLTSLLLWSRNVIVLPHTRNGPLSPLTHVMTS